MRLWTSVLVALLLLMGMGRAAAQSTPTERVANLAHDLGKTVTVQGRTGYVLSQYETPTRHVFTLTDDYNSQVLVREIGTSRPMMGVPYQITGTPVQDGDTLFLETSPSLITPISPGPAASPPPATPPVPATLPIRARVTHHTISPLVITLSSIATILLLAALGWWVWTRRTLPEWGVVTVTGGPDQGLSVPLRRRRIALGRGVHPTQDLRLSGGDPTVSNRHAVLEFRQGNLFLRDTSSNGTRLGGERLMPGRPVPLRSGDTIHLGTRDTTLLVRLHAPQPGLLGRLRPPVPLGEKTMMLPEPVRPMEAVGPGERPSPDMPESEPPPVAPPPPLVFPFPSEPPSPTTQPAAPETRP